MRSRIRFAAALSVAALAATTTTIPAPAQPATEMAKQWQWVQASPDRHQAALSDIDSRGGSTWAVGGDQLAVDFADQRPLALRRAGDRWVVTPQPVRTNAALNSVAVVAANDVWAVGEDRADPEATKPLVMHWNGRVWKVVPGPRVPTGSFSEVEVGRDGTVWAAGWANIGGSEHAAVYRYAGGVWKPATTGLEDALNANTLLVSSANDAWVGLNGGAGLAHFDGRTWKPVAGVPLYGTPTGLEGTGPDDIWLGGIDHDSGVPIGSSLLLHYDGQTWTRIAAPGGSTQLYDLTLRNGRPVAVGEAFDAEFRSQPLVLRFNGSEFVEAPAPTDSDATLTAATAVDGRLWTVGILVPTVAGVVPYAAYTDR